MVCLSALLLAGCGHPLVALRPFPTPHLLAPAGGQFGANEMNTCWTCPGLVGLPFPEVRSTQYVVRQAVTSPYPRMLLRGSAPLLVVHATGLPMSAAPLTCFWVLPKKALFH